jgi:hypothetical protein
MEIWHKHDMALDILVVIENVALRALDWWWLDNRNVQGGADLQNDSEVRACCLLLESLRATVTWLSFDHGGYHSAIGYQSDTGKCRVVLEVQTSEDFWASDWYALMKSNAHTSFLRGALPKALLPPD